jgi:hypothetical protein
MKKILTTSLLIVAVMTLSVSVATAQAKPTQAKTANPKAGKKKQTIELSAQTAPTEEVTNLQRPVNDKNNPVEKNRGDVYGDGYSDIIFDNWTGLYIDLYVDGSYRGSVAPWDVKTTWAIPGRTRLYAKASFTDGSYNYWSLTVNTGYQYTLKLK